MVSIVMTYFNRRNELLNTLKSIEDTKVDGLEVIIVDDASTEEHRIEDIVDNYGFNINLIRINDEDKNYTNPCVPYNMGFREVKNDIVIIQNPECLHVGNIIDYVINNVNDSNYLSFSCYNISEEDTKTLNQNPIEFLETFTPLPRNSDNQVGSVGWHNHSQYRAVGYHWCSAITKKNLDSLNGFDERFSDGIGWDDAEFYFRIGFLGLNTLIVDTPHVIHQYHYYDDVKYKDLNVGLLLNKNRGVLSITMGSKNYRANENSYYGHRD